MRISLLILMLGLATANAAHYTNSTAATIQLSLTNSSVVAGDDTIWLRAGTYYPPYTNANLTGTNVTSGVENKGWTVTIAGTAGHLITIRAYPGERVIMDRPWRMGSVGKYLRFIGIEFYDSLKGFNPGNPSYDNPRPWSHFDDSGGTTGNEWINCVIHDCNNVWASSAAGSVCRGNIIWNAGISQLDHVFYPAPATLSGNIVGWAMDNVIQGIGSTLVGTSNIFFGTAQTHSQDNGNDVLATGGTVVWAYNRHYNKWTTSHGGACIALEGTSTVTNNTLVSGIPLYFSGTQTAATVLNNTIGINSGINFGVIHRVSNAGSWTVNANTYFARSPYTVKFETNGTYINFTQWKATFSGYDTTSTSTDASYPSDSYHVIPNQDEPLRANIAIYNWSGADNVSVSLAGVLSSGNFYYLYSAQNYLAGPIQTGVYNGSSISVPMTNLSVAPLLYNTNTYYGILTNPPTTSPQFGAFVVSGVNLFPSSPFSIYNGVFH